MAIPRPDDFRRRCGKGPNIGKVTVALGDYWGVQDNPHRSVEDDVNAHQLLIAAGKTWIKLKDGKSDFKKTLIGHSNYINTKFTDRRTEIANIVREAAQGLMGLLQQHDLLTSDVRGALSFDVRKYQEKAKRRSSRHSLKGLSEGYQQERELWLTSGKTRTVSGSIVHDLMHDGLPGNANTRQAKSFQRIADQKGTAKDWENLAAIQQIGDMRVAFLKKSGRFEFMAYVGNGNFHDADDNPIFTNGQVLWAMDPYGNMFIFDLPQMRAAAGGIRQVNHSSITAGKEVMCAGMIETDQNGRVTYMSNTSGHYKPTPAHLAEAMEVLVGEGLDLSHADVLTVRFPGPRPGRAWWQHWSVAQFIQSRGLQGLISEEDGPMP